MTRGPIPQSRQSRITSAPGSVRGAFGVVVVALLCALLGLGTCLALMLGLAACGGEGEALLGKWHSDGEMDTIEFRADGIMRITSDGDGSVQELSWEADGSTLTVTEGASSRTAEVSIEGDALTIQCSLEDEPWFYERVVE